jgi:hypothetical protein
MSQQGPWFIISNQTFSVVNPNKTGHPRGLGTGGELPFTQRATTRAAKRVRKGGGCIWGPGW